MSGLDLAVSALEYEGSMAGLPLLGQKGRLLHGVSGVVLSSGFVLLPHLVLRLGITLSVALFLSTLFAAYYGAFHLVMNHAVNGAASNTTFSRVASAATGHIELSLGVAMLQWGAVVGSMVALVALAGSTLQQLAQQLCGSSSGCSGISISSWVLVFTFLIIIMAVVEPIRKGLILLQALPGCLAAAAILCMVLVDLFSLAPPPGSAAAAPPPPPSPGTYSSCAEYQSSLSYQELVLAAPAAALGVAAFVLGNQYLLPEALTSLDLPCGRRSTTLAIMESISTLYALMVLLYIPLSFLGFAVYGTCTKPSILGNTTSQPVTSVVAGLLLVLQVTIDILIREQTLHPHARELRKADPFSTCLWRVVLVLACGVVAALLPLTLSFASLAGSVFVLPIAFLLPTLLSQAKSANSPCDPQWFLNAALITIYGAFTLISAAGALYLLFVLGSARWEAIAAGDASLLQD